MSAAGRCPRCGGAIPESSPAGLCAACLMGLALDAGAPAAGRARALPRSLLTDGLRRLGWVGLALALTAAGVFLTGYFVQPGWVNPAAAPLSYSLGLGALAALGALLFALARFDWREPAAALDAALVVQAAAGFCIALAENSIPYGGDPIRSTSSLALWIAVFALTVPVSFGKALAAALATASMGPAGLGAQILMGNVPNPPPRLWMVLFTAPFLIAVASALLGKLIYRLGAEVQAAREYGGYQLVERIGGGGMGQVWRARHHSVGRQAAVKLIRPELFGAASSDRLAALRRFEREAHATAALHSPHTVSLYNYGLSDDGLLYYVMELVAGLDLETLVRRFGPLPAARAVGVVLQVCDSLEEAHGAGLIHRDIKPANIMLGHAGAGGDFAKVVDFGLAQTLGDERSLQLMAGTPAYMAPEVLSGHPADARSDIYSLGCVAYWLLSGQPVFAGATAAMTMQAHLKEAPVALSERMPDPAPPGLQATVMACIEKDLARRPASAGELAARLRRLEIEPPWTRQDADAWWTARTV